MDPALRGVRWSFHSNEPMSGATLMQRFLQAIRTRVPRLERATYSTIRLELGSLGEFTLVASWPEKGGLPAGEHRVRFDRRRVLGTTASSSPLQQRQHKRICRVHDEIVMEILRARGIK
jgi:hypothetical protein